MYDDFAYRSLRDHGFLLVSSFRDVMLSTSKHPSMQEQKDPAKKNINQLSIQKTKTLEGKEEGNLLQNLTQQPKGLQQIAHIHIPQEPKIQDHKPAKRAPTRNLHIIVPINNFHRLDNFLL